MISLKNLETFIRSVQSEYKESAFDGCRFIKLVDANEKHDTIYLIFGCMVFGDLPMGLSAKIATNIDDLQCDYDWDWGDPIAEEDDVQDNDPARFARNVIDALKFYLNNI